MWPVYHTHTCGARRAGEQVQLLFTPLCPKAPRARARIEPEPVSSTRTRAPIAAALSLSFSGDALTTLCVRALFPHGKRVSGRAACVRACVRVRAAHRRPRQNAAGAVPTRLVHFRPSPLSDAFHETFTHTRHATTTQPTQAKHTRLRFRSTCTYARSDTHITYYTRCHRIRAVRPLFVFRVSCVRRLTVCACGCLGVWECVCVHGCNRY